MNSTERSAKTPSPRTGNFATLRALLPLQGTGAPLPMSRIRSFMSAGLVVFGVVVGGALPSSASATLTVPAAPVVTTAPAQNVTRTTATISGTVNPEGAELAYPLIHETTYHVLYTDQEGYGRSTPEVKIGSGTVAQATEPLEVGALTPGTVYHYAIIATSTVKEIEDITVVETIEENGVVISRKEVTKVKVKEEKSATTIGPEQVLETSPPILPAFESSLVSNIGQSTATIATTLEAKGEPTRWELRLGRTPGNLQLQKAGNSRSPTPEPLVVGLETLESGTTYHYKLTAAAPDGTVESPEYEFTTAPAPPPPTLAVTPLIAAPHYTFPAEEEGATSPPKTATKCPKGKKRSHGKCVKVKTKSKKKAL